MHGLIVFSLSFFLFSIIIVSIARQHSFLPSLIPLPSGENSITRLVRWITLVSSASWATNSSLYADRPTVEPVPRDDEPVVLGPGQLRFRSRGVPLLRSNPIAAPFDSSPSGIERTGLVEILADRLSSQISFFSEKAERILIQRNR